MKRIVIIPLLTIFFASGVYAKCETNSKTLFSCLTEKGKQIEVCDTGKNISYSFGKPQTKPEIAVTVPREQVTTSQWNGVGRDISYAVNIPNDTSVYNVFFSADRLSDTHTIQAGVNVLIDNSLKTTVNCVGTNITNNLQGVDLKPSP